MREPAPVTFRKRLRELRQALRWTQKRAAHACKISPCLYQLYELGIKRNPELLTLDKIAKGFGIEVHELLSPDASRMRKRLPNQRAGFNRKRAKTRRKRA